MIYMPFHCRDFAGRAYNKIHALKGWGCSLWHAAQHRACDALVDASSAFSHGGLESVVAVPEPPRPGNFSILAQAQMVQAADFSKCDARACKGAGCAGTRRGRKGPRQ